jgi:hypothetical protein
VHAFGIQRRVSERNFAAADRSVVEGGFATPPEETAIDVYKVMP